MLLFVCVGFLCASQLDRERWARVESAFREMCSLHRIPWTTFAEAFLGVNPSQFQRALKGDATFDLRRFYQKDVPPEHAATFHTLALLELGVVPAWMAKASTATALLDSAKKEIA